MYIKWKLAQQSRSPSWGTIKSRTTINRGFSPAGTEEWALLKTPEEHMLRHSLLRPQMFLNSWFPQVAFPFSPRYCANYFSARSTWVACCSDCASSAPFFFFFFFSPPLPQKHPTQGPLNIRPSCATHWFLNTIDCFEMLMRADGAFFLLFAFAAKSDLCRANFLRGCSHSGVIQANSYI